MSPKPSVRSVYWLLLIATLLTATVYWPGLYGGWLFDDYPNIVDNPGVQPHQVSIPALARAAMSSPASDFKRPLASLSFAANYLLAGLDPWSWKLTNLVLHLLNGLLVFLLARGLFRSCRNKSSLATGFSTDPSTDLLALLLAAGWMLLPINLTAVLYVVQREESLANLFVLAGMIGYIAGRQRMLSVTSPIASNFWKYLAGFTLCIASLTLPVVVGMRAKETAIMLPLYAFLVECIVFKFDRTAKTDTKKDGGIVLLFIFALLLPLIIGIFWLMPSVLSPNAWATRDFSLHTRLLSEARVVCDYIAWILLPTPSALSFYHDQFQASSGLLSPWTTLVSTLTLAALVIAMLYLRHRQPLAALGIGLYLGCHLLTGTILPLELVYEHRNYFASFGVLLTVIPWLAALPRKHVPGESQRHSLPLAKPRRILLACLLLWWTLLTALTANAWGDPLRLAQELAARGPDSPRAEYELGRTYIIESGYDPNSPYTRAAYAPLEAAAALPDSSILPEQALIFMNARMHLPVKDAWWRSMITKLKVHRPGIQDESSLGSLTQCAREHACALPTSQMVAAFDAALSHPGPSARLLAMYGDYAWNVLGDRTLGERMTEAAVEAKPSEPAYHIILARMLIVQGYPAKAQEQLSQLEALNVGGSLNQEILELRTTLQHPSSP